LIRALKPQIYMKNIAVDLNNERLLINLARATSLDQARVSGNRLVPVR
jgi:hypothetical protein